MKKEFPIFKNNPDLVFLDSAASAQKPKVVINSMVEVMETHYANIHRGIYDLSQKSTTKYEEARSKIAGFINATPNEIVFTRGATESINLVAQTWGKANLKAGDEIIISILEHHANIVPWQMLETEIGIKIKVIPLTDEYKLDFDAFKALISDKTKLLALTGMSNAIGTTIDTKKFINEAKKHSITTLIDGCQSVVHGKHDMKVLDCDFFVFSGHKLYGPTGIGVLYGKYELLEKMPPYQTGGDMVKTVSLEKGTTFNTPPARFEAGTPAIVEAIALGSAIDFLEGHKSQSDWKNESNVNHSPLEGESKVSKTSFGEGENNIQYKRREYRKKLKSLARSLRKDSTLQEGLIWRILKNSQTGYKFRRQFNIDNKYIADFICLEKKIIIEVDGSQHDDSEDDKIRDKYIEAQGFKILRFWNNEILENIEGVYDIIIEALDSSPSPKSKISTLPQGESDLDSTLTNKTIEVLNKIEGINIIGSNQHGIISFTADWGSPEDVSTLLNQQNIAVRIGYHCAAPLMDYLNLPSGTVRISFGIYNDADDVNKLEQALIKCHKMLS